MTMLPLSQMLRSPNGIRILIALAAVLLSAWTQWPGAAGGSDLTNEWLRDEFIRLRASETPEERIAVIDIDEASLAEVGPWPWPRKRLADLAENLLLAYGAKAVALDLVLPERADKEGDSRLAALGAAAPLVLAQAFDYSSRAAPLKVGTVNGGVTPMAGITSVPATGYIGNHAGLADTRTFGNIGLLPDADGMVRRLPIFSELDGRHYPTLSLALIGCCDRRLASMQAENGFWRVPYSRAWSAYTAIPAADILNFHAPRQLLAGKLVLVGSSSLGLSDRVATPLGTSTPGVLVHAAALTQLLDQYEGKLPLHVPGRLIAVLFSALVALCAVYTLPRLSAIANVGLIAAASLAWMVVAFWLTEHDPFFSSTGPLVTNLLLLGVAIPYDWQLAQRRSRHLLGTLQQYVARSVVDELLRRDLKNVLTPQQCEVTTLIADMEGYTGKVESLSVEEAAQLTRDFLDCLTRPVLEKQGTLDKYTGDGLVAFWGAPLPIANHADLALDAAKGIQREVRRLSAAREAKGLPGLRVRIGIESGTAMAGDFGTQFRSVYTAVGDSVNVASRLEDFARGLPHDIIVGEGTVTRSKTHRFIKLGDAVLRGKEKRTTIFTIADQGHGQEAL